ncbi:MAG TPA: hypothetical protein VHF70_00595 [Rubrobacteraceae bacterium]|nr:hypothetical protein [Rubrobacteraceae bacterium]
MRKSWIIRAYEWFFELPVAVVLVLLWLAGVGVVGLCALLLYSLLILLRAATGG